MIKYYVTQIRMGKMKIEDVPAKWQYKVQDALDAGLYMPGDILGEGW